MRKRESLISALEPFQDDPSIFVHLTNTLKLGINPKTKWTDPIGIYFYPVREMFENFKTRQIPYGSDYKYAFIVRNTGHLLNLSTYPSQIHDDANLLLDIYDRAMNLPFDGDDTPEITSALAVERWLKNYGYQGGEGLWDFTDRMASFVARRTGKDSRMVWRKLFVDLGYDGAIDLGDNIISSNEPNQAVFFNPTFDVLKAVVNDTNRIPMRGVREDL